MKLVFALYKPEEFDYTPHRHCHAMSILSVGDIKCCSTTLCFAGEEREVHGVCSHEERSFRELTHKRLDPFELIFRERLPPECYGVVRLRTGLGDGDGIVPAFIYTFD